MGDQVVVTVNESGKQCHTGDGDNFSVRREGNRLLRTDCMYDAVIIHEHRSVRHGRTSCAIYKSCT